jgi:signal transduction histidine kinase
MQTQLESEKANQSVMEHIILGVAHELNNPNTFVRMNAINLRKMLGLIGPCLDEYAQNHPEAKFGPYTLSELRDKMFAMNESILGATVRIITIADKLKQCSSFAMSTSSMVSLSALIQSVVSMHQFLLDRWAEFEFIFDAADPYEIDGHQLQLEQALSILLTNACDAISDRYKAANTKGHIRVTLSKDGPNIKIIFRDDGCGMNEETMQKIFAPYFTTKPQGVGDGLGLALCRAVLDRHGGSIQVRSQLGEWTEFEVLLPRHAVR